MRAEMDGGRHKMELLMYGVGLRPVEALVLFDSNRSPWAAVDSCHDLLTKVIGRHAIEHDQTVIGLKFEHVRSKRHTDSVRLAEIGVDHDSHAGAPNAIRSDSGRRIVL